MGEMAVDERRVVQMVKALCDSVSGGDALFGIDSSTSYDKTLARLLDMGYDFELATRAIRDCGNFARLLNQFSSAQLNFEALVAHSWSLTPWKVETLLTRAECAGRLDVEAIIDHINAEAPTFMAASMDSSTMVPEVHSIPLSRLNGEANADGEEQHRFIDENGHSKNKACDASTSRSNGSVEIRDDEGESLRPRKRSLSLSVPLDSLGKGKTLLTASDEVDSDGWEYDDDVDGDKESSLLRMGFSLGNVTDSLEACGEQSDINHLANYIINNMVPYDPTWEDDYGLVGEEVGDQEGIKEASGDRANEEWTDQELLILKKMRRMGCSLSMKMVSDAIQACGKDAPEDELVDYLLGADEQRARVGTSDDGGEDLHQLSKVQQLKRLGNYSTAACLRAIDNNGDAEICDLLDYLAAEKLAEEDQELVGDDGVKAGGAGYSPAKRRKSIRPPKSIRKGRMVDEDRKGRIVEEDDDEEDEETSPKFYRNLKGFGLPGEPVIPRVLSEDIAHPPYFYFENVALMPKDEWRNIERHLYNIAPEFVDSLNFSPCRRPRGYIHNLPLEGRADILAKPPLSIQELIPGSDRYWPRWDPRVKLNTINTRTASEFVRRQIQESLTACERGEPSASDVKTILFWARKWNLVWIRPGVLAPLRPEEVETCLGFDQHHTRVLYSPVDRMRVLGNSFQVNTVAFHLSVLRQRYLSGIRVLSLFSGIGGAEVALHKLGIFLKVVVSVEIDRQARMVVDTWWKTTNQTGRLIHDFTDVRDLDSKAIQKLVEEYGGFDLIIGGSPCNNLSGNNRCTRVGLAGTASVSFFEFPRILADVRDFMGQRRR